MKFDSMIELGIQLPKSSVQSILHENAVLVLSVPTAVKSSKTMMSLTIGVFEDTTAARICQKYKPIITKIRNRGIPDVRTFSVLLYCSQFCKDSYGDGDLDD